MECFLEIENNLATIILNRAEKSNSIGKILLSELNENLNQAKQNKKLRLLVLKGSGEKVFSAGADLKERIAMSKEEIIQFLDLFRETCFLLQNLKIPTIAAMNGSAFGGGLELSLCTDLRFLQEGAEIGLTETKLGIIPGAGGTQRLTRLIGESKTKELIFTARRIDAKKAKELGIVNDTFPKEKFHQELKKVSDEILSSAPIAVSLAKQTIELGLKTDLEKGISIERESYLKTLETEDRLEALKAFSEKRKPIFRGE
jgi:methylglutaconyl-CoA hydratase